MRRAAERVLSATNAWLHSQTMGSDGRFEKDRGYVCTFSALILKGRDLHLLHVGDSRIKEINFTTLESVDGAGTKNKENNYRFEDTAPILSLVYYRLKQIDFNGEFEYSNIVSLDFGDAEVNRGKLRVGPNPVSSGSYAYFGSADRPVRQTVKIFNSMNQIVREYSDDEGFSTEGLGAGIYIVRNQAGEIFRLVIK